MRYLGQSASRVQAAFARLSARPSYFQFRAVIWLIGAGRHGEHPSRSSCHFGFTSPAFQFVGCLDLSYRHALSLSAYRGAAVLFQFLDVLVAAAHLIPRLVGSFCCAAIFNAQGAERESRTAIEWCARWLASRESAARQHAVTTASRAAGPKSQHWAKVPNGEVVHNATSTVDPAPNRASETIVPVSPRADTSSSLLDHYSTCSRHQPGLRP